MSNVPKLMKTSAGVIALAVSLHEIFYFLEHQYRPGPSVVIALLGFTVALLAFSDRFNNSIER